MVLNRWGSKCAVPWRCLHTLSHSLSLSPPCPCSSSYVKCKVSWKKNWNKMLKNCVVFGIVRPLLLLLRRRKKFQFVAQFLQRCHAQPQPPGCQTISSSQAWGMSVLPRRVGHLAERVHLNGRKFEKNWNLSLWYMKVDLFDATPTRPQTLHLPASECVISLPTWPIPFPARGSLSGTSVAIILPFLLLPLFRSSAAQLYLLTGRDYSYVPLCKLV